MIQINESIPVKSRDDTPVNSGLYLFYGKLILEKDSVNDLWFVNITIFAFESINYAVKVKYSRGGTLNLFEDKIKSTYSFKFTDQEIKNNSLLSLVDSKIALELNKEFTPSNVVITP